MLSGYESVYKSTAAPKVQSIIRSAMERNLSMLSFYGTPPRIVKRPFRHKCVTIGDSEPFCLKQKLPPVRGKAIGGSSEK